VVQDKLFLPGLRKLARLVQGGFFGRILSVRGEFGYWVFEGDWQRPQRPSWNYRAEDGGGIVADMFPHWEYVLHELFGRVRTVQALTATHIPRRWDERDKPYEVTADDAAYGIFELEGGAVAQINSSWAVRVNRDELVEFQVDGTDGSAVAGLRDCRVQHRSGTPKPVWNPDLPAEYAFRDQWQEVPDNDVFDNGFKAQWELFLRHVVLDEPWRWDLLAGARGVQLAELGLRSSAGPPLRRAGADAVSILLPTEDGDHRIYVPRSESVAHATNAPLRSRVVYSAAHVVADPLRAATGAPAAVDWDATLAFRRHLWAHGLGVAEAMDTAQRGMGLDWAAAAELIRRSSAEARSVGGLIACGVGTDQVPGPAAALAEVTAAYEEQLTVVEAAGSQAVLMASRALAAIAKGPDDYLEVYGHLLRQSSDRVILHWLGPMFDPALAGYWGSDDLDTATDTFLDVVTAHPDKVDGVKISLLDADREVALRHRLPEGVRCYTGDDFHYPELIQGDDHGFSHALLGVFDPLAPLAAAAVSTLDTGDTAGFRRLLDPTVALSRHLFGAPTRFYKTGVVLLAWLAGHQSHFTMLGGLQSARSLPHLARAYELADRVGLFPDPAFAETRMRRLLALHGVGA
jgi:hypothetical protein